MTNDERATIYGRAMLELKECNTSLAALGAYFSEYTERLEGAQRLARKFALDPLAIAPDQVAFSKHVKNNNLSLTTADFGDKVDEMVRLVKRARELKEQVDKF